MSAKAWAKTKTIIIAVNIFGAAEGFLPKALILERPQTANTPHGPKTQRLKITISVRLRPII